MASEMVDREVEEAVAHPVAPGMNDDLSASSMSSSDADDSASDVSADVVDTYEDDGSPSDPKFSEKLRSFTLNRRVLSKILPMNSDDQKSVALDKVLESSSWPGSDMRFKYAWTIWEKTASSGAAGDTYAEAMRPLCSVHNVGEFWHAWLSIPQPSELYLGGKLVRPIVRDGNETVEIIDTMMIFKANVKPEWEDACNKAGGHFQYVFKAPSGGFSSTPASSYATAYQLDECWNNLVIGIMGGQIGRFGSVEVTGLRLVDKMNAGKNSGVRIEVWFTSFHENDHVQSLRSNVEHVMFQRLDGSHSTSMKCELKSHLNER